MFRLLGLVLGKAILEKVPISPHLDYTILNRIIQRKTQVDDLEHYDEGVLTRFASNLQSSYSIS
jgi:hypothetical protein